jgi:hypothetical protein
MDREGTRCWFRVNWPRPGGPFGVLQSDPRDSAHEWVLGLYWVGRQKVPELRRNLEHTQHAQVIDTDFGGPFGEVIAPGTVEATEQSLLTLLDAIPAERRRKFLRYLESAVHPDGVEQLPPRAGHLRWLVQEMRGSEL